jgi:tetratricopeptide (TPR) repeat protein
MQMKFYSDLEEHWRDVAWLGSKGQSGPTIAIYQNPASERPDTEFAQDLYHGLSDMSGSATDFFLGRLAHLCMRAGYETRASGVVQELSRIKGMSGARPGTAASFYHTYAATELARGDKASALAAFRKSVELGSDNARTYLLLTNLLLEARRPEEARPILRRIVEADLSGTDSETYAEVGRILRGMREMAASTTAYRKALVLDPDAVSARVNLGWDLFIGGSYDGAVTEYLLALETEANSTAQFRLGLAYLAKGDVANARAAYSRGVAVHGADEGRRVGAADDLQRLASLGKHAAEAREILETYWSDGAR